MSDDVRWGFLGPGNIATSVVADLPLVDGAVPLAVASRDRARAQRFADEHGFERAYGSYDELLADGDVDVVYVASPHAQHHRYVTTVLDAGKPVLVEKAFTVSLAAARDLVARARERRLFCMEAMWTRHLPVMGRLRELVADGAIGEVRSVEASFGFRREVDPTDRLWAPELGGGALLDLGVYPVSFAHMLLGPPETVDVRGALGPTGVDADVALLLAWPDGATARLACSITSHLRSSAVVAGTLGHVVIEPPFHHPPRFTLHRPDAEPEVVEAPPVGTGYSHELAEVQRCLAAGLTESPTMPLDDTLAVMATLDTALEALGAVHVDEGF